MYDFNIIAVEIIVNSDNFRETATPSIHPNVCYHDIQQM